MECARNGQAQVTLLQDTMQIKHKAMRSTHKLSCEFLVSKIKTKITTRCRDFMGKKDGLYATDLLSVLIHLAHSTFLTMRPFCSTDTFCRLGLNLRLVARKENERLCPKAVALPQVAHLAIVYVPFLQMIPVLPDF